MANNPLYPGYTSRKEKEDSINPIFPGYYAGQPIQRKPKRKDFIKPIEYNTDELMQEVENAARKVTLAPIAGPRWVKTRILEDWKDSMKVSIKPGSVKVTALDDYSTQDFPGALGLSMSLNPFDWLKDPKKQAKKTLGTWTDTVVGLKMANPLNSDFSDIENRTRRAVWREALGFPETEDNQLLKAAGKETEKRTVKPFEGYNNTSPLNLYETGVIRYETRGSPKSIGNRVDVYKQVVDNVGQFEELRDSAPLRDRYYYNIFAKSMIDAVDTEMQNKLNAGSRNPAVSAALRDNEGKIRLFSIKNDFAKDMGDLSWAISGDTGVTVKLKKALILSKNNPNRDVGIAYAINDLVDAVSRAKTERQKNLSKVQALVTTGKITQEEASKFSTLLTDYNKALTDLENKTNTLKSSPNISDASIDMLKNVTAGGTYGRKFGPGDILKLGVERDYLGKIQEEITNGGLGGINTVITDSRLESGGDVVHAKKMIPLAITLKQERVGFATKEFLEGWDQDKLLERYLWNNIVEPRIHAYTPATITQNFLEKNYYFGLKVGDDDGAYIPTDPIKLARFGKKYQYYAKLNLAKVDNKFLEKYNLTLSKDYFTSRGLSKLIVKGGDRFKIMDDFKILSIKLDDQAQRNLVKGLLSGTMNLDNPHVFDLLKGRMFGGNTRQEVSRNATLQKRFDDLNNHLQEYRSYIRGLSGKLGVDNINDAEFQLNLFLMLSYRNDKLPPDYQLTKKYAGKFENLFVKLSDIKTWFQENVFIGRAIANYNALKLLIQKRFVNFLSEWVARIVASAAMLQVLLPIIERVATFVINKLFTYGETFVKGLLTWDLEDFNKLLTKDLTRLVKSCTIVFLFIAVSLVLPIVILFGVIGSSISPIDPTVGNSPLGYGNMTPGENLVVKITKDVKITLPNGTTLVNPTDSIDNDILNLGPILVNYTISVTPKVTITDAIVTVDDTAAFRNNDNDSGKLLDIPEFTVQPFIEGQTKTYPLKQIKISGDKFKDSLINNFAVAYTPYIEGLSDVDSVGFSRSFIIGNGRPLVEECNGYSINAASLPAFNPKAGAIASQAYEIAKTLERGFWCMFNHQMNDKFNFTSGPEYSLWSEDIWAANGINLPYPLPDNGIYMGVSTTNILFWCNALIYKTYQAFGITFGYEGTTHIKEKVGGGYLKEQSPDYNPDFKYSSVDNIKISEVKPGDLIFFKIKDSQGSHPHIGMVYEVTEKGINTIESNNTELTTFLPADPLNPGYIQEQCPGGTVEGFATWKGNTAQAGP